MKTDVMIIGLGGVGRRCLEFLVREPSVSSIVGADIREEYGQGVVNIASAGAVHMGYYPEAKFVRMDLLEDVDKNAELVKKINPRIILNCTSMLTWWAPAALLPSEILKPLEDIADLGPFVPLHLRLTYHLMQAVDKSGIKPLIVNGAYGDAVGPALERIGLTPTVGMGNVDSEVAYIRMIVAERENLKPRDIRVYYVGHHFNSVWMERGGEPVDPPPFYLKIVADYRDVTRQYELAKLQKDAGRMWGGDYGDSLTASSQCKHALAMLNDERILTVAVSPNGLVGAYPVWLGAGGPKLALPDDISLNKAIDINLGGQLRDGIEEIRKDGTIVFPDNVVKVVKDIFGFECKSFHVTEVDEVAIEQKRKFDETVSKFKK